MKHIKIGIVGLICAALFAISGVSLAPAAEFGRCVSVKKTGNYTESSCQTVAKKAGKPDHKGIYEWAPADTCYPTKGGNYTESKCETVAEEGGKPDHKGPYEKVLLTAALAGGREEWTSSPGTGTCNALEGTQQVTSPTTFTTELTFLGCKFGSFSSCENTGTSGEIRTFELDGVLTEPTAGTASVKLVGTGSDGYGGAHEGQYLDEFLCVGFGSDVRVYGELAGRVTGLNISGVDETMAVFEEEHLVSEWTGASGPHEEWTPEGWEQRGGAVSLSNEDNGEIKTG